MALTFRKILTLRGPNIWARFPVLEVWVDLEELKDTSSDLIPGFNERLMGWLPSMYSHRCSVGTPGGFFERLRRGTWMGHILEHVTLELQELAGTPVGFGKARESTEEGVYKVIIEYAEETLGRACLFAARDLCLAAIHNLPYDVSSEIHRLRRLADQVCLGPSTRAIVESAEKQGIPWMRLNSGSLVQLGHGCRQRRIRGAETENTTAIAELIAQDKELTKKLLRAAGVPVPEGREVFSASDAWEAACELNAPAVIKPLDANHGRGVTINLINRDKIEEAYRYAAMESSDGTVVVERMIPGFEHRLLVVGARVVAASRGEPAYVQGDGEHSISQLVELQLNSDPRRGDEDLYPLARIEFDPSVLLTLEQAGWNPDSVPPPRQQVLIRYHGNLAVDCTANVHPDVAARAVEAARIVGLDIAGLDLVAEDISRPLEDQLGAIVEINSMPGLHMHVKPLHGPAQPVGDAIVATQFAPGETGRIPIVGVTGTNGKTTVVRLITRMLESSFRYVGMTCSEGIYLDGRKMASGDCSGPRSARSVLWNPYVQAAVFETGRGGILREGLGFDKCTVAVVTNVGDADHLGQHWVDTPEQMAYVKQTLVEAVLPTGTAILNAQDPLVVGMAEACKGSILYFSLTFDHPVVIEHLAAGGKAISLRNGKIVLAEGAQETQLLSVADIPATHNGRIEFQIANILATAAAAWVVGVRLDTICEQLKSFTGDWKQTPGRFNVHTVGNRTVILDHAHNTSALTALVRSVDLFPIDRRTIVFSPDVDQHEADLVRHGEILGNAFDQVVLYFSSPSDSASPEARTALRYGLSRGQRIQNIVETDDLTTSVARALQDSDQNDLLVIQTNEIDKSMELLSPCLGWCDSESSTPIHRQSLLVK